MKSILEKAFLFILIAFFLNACSKNKIEIANTSKQNAYKYSTSTNLLNTSENTNLVIYDFNSESAGLEQVNIELTSKSGNIKKDIINAFLKNTHFLSPENQMSLSRIEVIGSQTIFHLSSLEGIENPKDLHFFKKALELTLLRHLRTNDFNIIYGQTARL